MDAKEVPVNRFRRLAPTAALAAAALFVSPSLAQDAPPKEAEKAAAPSGKEEKVRRLVRAMKVKDLFLAEVGAQLEGQESMGVLPKGFAKKFAETADTEAYLDIVAKAWSEHADEATVDAAIAFYESPAGEKFTAAQAPIARSLEAGVQAWAMEASMKTMQALTMDGSEDEEMGGGETMEESKEEEGGLLGTLKRAKIFANETAATATLRNLGVCQAQVEATGKIDCDRDGIGEHGTFLEMTGTVGTRNGYRETGPHGPSSSDFSTTGTPINPAPASPSLAGVDENGIVRKNGYCYRVFLPDGARTSGFVHETGPKEKPGLAGGTGTVGVDLSETTWCAYAWPEKIGETGNRVFFVNQYGDIMQSPNEKARWEGTTNPVKPDAAYLGVGCTSQVAVGTADQDGDVWKITN